MNNLDKEYFKKILFIRKFEELLLDLFEKGMLSGTTHTSIGQEVIPVVLMDHLKRNDVVFSNHRCHGHYISYGGDPELLLAEIMGKDEGMNGGRGGSQHLCYKNFYSNGVQGGIVGNSLGVALTEKFKNTKNIVVVFLGDGTLGEGLVYESLNIAALWSLPVLFLLENNYYAQSTPTEKVLSGSIKLRANAFGIQFDETDSRDPIVLNSIFKDSIDIVRSNREPFFLMVHTYRLSAHSKGDDNRKKSEIENYKKKDSLQLLKKRINSDEVYKIEKETNKEIELLLTRSKKFKPPNPNLGIHDLEKAVYFKTNEIPTPPSIKGKTYLQSINMGLHSIMDSDKSIFVVGEDILDPYGGAFKVTKGLSTKYPKRVLTTPISEAAITAIAVGAALNNFKPIVEIMFGDFITLATDQLVNHAAKYAWMYKNKKKLSMVLRSPMGGRRGYGPTHSQNLEKLFFGIPGINIICPSLFHNPGLMLHNSIYLGQPVIFVECKSLYSKELKIVKELKYDFFSVQSDEKAFPTFNFSLSPEEPADITFVTYGAAVEYALEAAEYLYRNEEIKTNIVVPSLLSPLPIDTILLFLGKCRKIITIEEGTKRGGWGSEVISSLSEKIDNISSTRIAATNTPIPSSRTLEDFMYYNTMDVVKLALKMEKI